MGVLFMGIDRTIHEILESYNFSMVIGLKFWVDSLEAL
jgi:hypothetical protein